MFDEAHNIESIAEEASSKEFPMEQINNLLKEIRVFHDRSQSATSKLFTQLLRLKENHVYLANEIPLSIMDISNSKISRLEEFEFLQTIMKAKKEK